MRHIAHGRLILSAVILAGLSVSATGFFRAAEPKADPAKLAKILGGAADGWTIAPATYTVTGEPALAAHEGWKRIAFEKPPLGSVGEHAAKAAAGRGDGDVFGERRRRLQPPARRLGLVGEQEPEEAVRGKREEVRQVARRREGGAAGELDRHRAAIGGEVDLDRLGLPRKVDD